MEIDQKGIPGFTLSQTFANVQKVIREIPFMSVRNQNGNNRMGLISTERTDYTRRPLMGWSRKSQFY